VRWGPGGKGGEPVLSVDLDPRITIFRY
jgi:hypothetical protein